MSLLDILNPEIFGSTPEQLYIPNEEELKNLGFIIVEGKYACIWKGIIGYDKSDNSFYVTGDGDYHMVYIEFYPKSIDDIKKVITLFNM